MSRRDPTQVIIEINGQPAFAWGLEGMLVFGATNLAVQAGSNEFVAVVSDIFGRSDTNAVTVSVQDQAFEYDLNGNLTNDGVRAYSWDEADRLIEVRDLQTSDVLVQNRYDGLSRRRERIQLEDGILVTNRYVYDGWLVVAVLDGDNEVLEQYVHGVDLSGTREGAGGIGGILQAVGDEVAYYHYDGNGNVISATDSNAVVMTRLEYDPFGRVLVADGSYTPRYQFSSKEYDTATGLNYYGYRYYSPELGRWLSRDPAEEGAGQNLYSFVDNSPIDNTDYLGLLLYTVRLDPPATPSKCRRVNWLISSRAVGLNQTLWDHWRAGSGSSMGVDMSDFDSSGVRSRHLDAAVAQGCSEGQSLQIGQSGASNYQISNEQNYNYVQTPMIYGWRMSVLCQVLYSKNCSSDGQCVVDVLVNCEFDAHDHVNFWPNSSRFWIPGFPVDYSIADQLVRDCNPSGRGFDVTANQTLQRSGSCPCN